MYLRSTLESNPPINLGWLSPNGRFFEAGYLEHLEKARDICREIYGIEEPSTPDEILMEKGWVHITESTIFEYMFMFLFYGHLTMEQKQYLKPICEEWWDWIHSTCKTDLNEELELDYEMDWRN